MSKGWLLRHKFLAFVPLALVLIVATACGGDDATPEPTAMMEPTTAMEEEPTAVMEDATTAAVGAPTATPVPEPTRADDTPTPVATATPVPIETVYDYMMQPWFKDGMQGGGIIPMTHGACHVDYWDPHQSTIACGSAGFSPVFSQIMMWNHTNPSELVGDLAQAWSWSDDGMQLTINLHEAMWSDGESLNADDVVFSLDRMVDPVPPKPRAQSINPYYESSEVIDDRTLVINTKVPNPPGLLQYLALDYMKIMPKHIPEAEGFDLTGEEGKRALGEFNLIPENIVASGPFLVDEYIRGESYRLIRNPNYFKEGLPYLDGFNSIKMADRTAMIAAFDTEAIYMCNQSGACGLDAKAAIELEERWTGKVNIHWLPPSAFDHLLLNFTRPPFDNEDLRKAVYIGQDRLWMLQKEQAGRGRLGTPFYPETWMTPSNDVVATWPGFRYVDNDGNPVLDYYQGQEVGVDIHKDPRDIQMAQDLMKKHGYDENNMLKIELSCSASTSGRESCSLDKQMLESIYIDVEIVAQESSARFADIRAGKYDMMENTHGANLISADDVFIAVYLPKGAKNFQDWDHPEIQRLFQAQFQEPDIAKRQQLVWEAGDLIRS
ncbi:MAG: hypothetical protein J4F46_10940, partial [Dehalococcoidia bacterium]|nr:hypothetical protein [Dehalococcoidia bacterium]